MFKSPAFNGIALVLLAGAFAGAFFFLLRERFAVGDIYSEYSTYRTDPRGSSVLYEGIGRLANVEARRNIAPVARIAGDARRTVIFNGIDPFEREGRWEMDAEAARLAEEGSRVVLVLAPRTGFTTAIRGWLDERERRGSGREDSENEEEPREAGAVEEERPPRWLSFGTRMGAGLRIEEMDTDNLPLPAVPTDAEWFDGRHPGFWLSGVYFEVSPEEWRILLEARDRPVLVEREMGEGSVVLMSDAFWLSNEALLRHSRPEFLAWLIGPGEEVVFDETHLGTTRRIGIMWLLREFGFTPAIVVLLAGGLLFAWKNLVPFPPRESTPAGRKGVSLSGRDAGKGLVNLLRRTIPSRKILAACWAQWKDSQSPAVRERKADLVARVDRLVEAERSANPERQAAAYREIDQLIHKQK